MAFSSVSFRKYRIHFNQHSENYFFGKNSISQVLLEHKSEMAPTTKNDNMTVHEYRFTFFSILLEHVFL